MDGSNYGKMSSQRKNKSAKRSVNHPNERAFGRPYESTRSGCSRSKTARSPQMNQSQQCLSDSDDSAAGHYSRPNSYPSADEYDHIDPRLNKIGPQGATPIRISDYRFDLKQGTPNHSPEILGMRPIPLIPTEEDTSKPWDTIGLPLGRSYFAARYSNPFLQDLSPPPGFRKLPKVSRMRGKVDSGRFPQRNEDFIYARQQEAAQQEEAAKVAQQEALRIAQQQEVARLALRESTGVRDDPDEDSVFNTPFTSSLLEGLLSVTDPDVYNMTPKNNVFCNAMSNIGIAFLDENRRASGENLGNIFSGVTNSGYTPNYSQSGNLYPSGNSQPATWPPQIPYNPWAANNIQSSGNPWASNTQSPIYALFRENAQSSGQSFNNTQPGSAGGNMQPSYQQTSGSTQSSGYLSGTSHDGHMSAELLNSFGEELRRQNQLSGNENFQQPWPCFQGNNQIPDLVTALTRDKRQWPRCKSTQLLEEDEEEVVAPLAGASGDPTSRSHLKNPKKGEHFYKYDETRRRRRSPGVANSDDELQRDFQARNMSSHSSTPKNSTTAGMCCSFCKANREMPGLISSHNLKNDGKISCPVLRKFVCTICGISGDFAHTLRYCPFNKNANDPKPKFRYSASGKRIYNGRRNVY